MKRSCNGHIITVVRQLAVRAEFWILLLFLIRLVGITNPPLEKSHNWRQCTGLMAARNFYETDANILYPRLDESEGGSDVFGMEFPSLNYLHALVARVFGYAHWYGRLINLIVSSFGLLFFALLLRRLRFDERVVLAATLALGCSIWFSFSRKMMPDTYCISLAFIALFFAVKYLDTGAWWRLVLYLFFGSLAVLSKIPAGIWFVFLVPAVFVKAFPCKHRVALSVATIVPVALTVWWYFVWCPHLSAESGHWYNLGKSLSEGFSDITNHLPETLDNFYFDAFNGYVFFVVFVMGIVMAVIRRQRRLLLGLGMVFMVFIVYILKSGFFFYHHNYYSIPIVPAMAVVVGYGLSQLSGKWLAWLLLFIGCVEGIANQQHDFFLRKDQMYKLRLEEVADKVTKRDDLIMVNGNGNQQMMYLSHRKGWNTNEANIQNAEYLDKAIEKGCRFVCVDLHTAPDFTLDKPMVYKDGDFVFYRLDN